MSILLALFRLLSFVLEGMVIHVLDDPLEDMPRDSLCVLRCMHDISRASWNSGTLVLDQALLVQRIAASLFANTTMKCAGRIGANARTEVCR